MKIMKKTPKNNNSSNFFQHLKKWILCINFIHDIDHSITNYNKTSSNSVPEFVYELSGSGFESSCSHNLWYLFLLQVKEYHEDWPCKTTKFGAFRKKISFRQLRHMTIIFEKKENAWLAHTILDSNLRMKTFKCKKSARADFMGHFWMQSIYLQFGRCRIFWECYLLISKPHCYIKGTLLQIWKSPCMFLFI